MVKTLIVKYILAFHYILPTILHTYNSSLSFLFSICSDHCLSLSLAALFLTELSTSSWTDASTDANLRSKSKVKAVTTEEEVEEEASTRKWEGTGKLVRDGKNVVD